jgi:amino acid transporter
VRFPRSGGPYVFAQRVLGVEAAFAVGWLVAFASLAAAAVFALGFARFAVPIAGSTFAATGSRSPDGRRQPRAEVPWRWVRWRVRAAARARAGTPSPR